MINLESGGDLAQSKAKRTTEEADAPKGRRNRKRAREGSGCFEDGCGPIRCVGRRRIHDQAVWCDRKAVIYAPNVRKKTWLGSFCPK
ncbi:MAG: hypothetical protein CM15mP77_2810 [Synechococcus sp.]|nr:MAG: hypothetical protein CM15mP77_2810 [Synechococcus sp.]